MKKDLISIKDLSEQEIYKIFNLAAQLKKEQKQGKSHNHLLAGKTIAMLFEKPSLRTRMTFEVGMYQLGGHTVYERLIGEKIGDRESVQDVAKNLERWVDGIVVRTFSHQNVTDLAKFTNIPVINALTDLLHPCQILTDMFTILEKKGRLDGIKVAYIGDGNNICNSWIYGAEKTGIVLKIACPEGYEPSKEMITKELFITHNPEDAVKDSDIVYTDVWVSMGQESEKADRKIMFQAFQINKKLLLNTNHDVLIMHCLPAHRGEEITDEVIDSPNAIVFDEAENRLHIQKAILNLLLRDEL
ncbi:MAG: ornithine carbamoyltransferase [bacterium]|nr:ornithine carbamoyltransferase [bacterium]